MRYARARDGFARREESRVYDQPISITAGLTGALALVAAALALTACGDATKPTLRLGPQRHRHPRRRPRRRRRPPPAPTIPTPNIDTSRAAAASMATPATRPPPCAMRRAPGAAHGGTSRASRVQRGLRRASGPKVSGSPTPGSRTIARLPARGRAPRRHHRQAAPGLRSRSSEPTARGFDEFFGFFAGATTVSSPTSPA